MNRFAMPRALAGNPSWLITFVDLVMLLLTFFVLMFSVSTPVAERFAPVVASYAAAFTGSGGGTGSAQPYSYARTSDDKGDELVYLESVLRPAFERSATLNGFQFQRSSQYLILSLPAKALFTDGEARLLPTAQAISFDLAGVLSNVSNPLAVVGRGGAWALGLNRAERLAGALAGAGLTSRVAMLSRDDAIETIEILIFASGDRK